MEAGSGSLRFFIAGSAALMRFNVPMRLTSMVNLTSLNSIFSSSSATKHAVVQEQHIDGPALSTARFTVSKSRTSAATSIPVERRIALRASSSFSGDRARMETCVPVMNTWRFLIGIFTGEGERERRRRSSRPPLVTMHL